MLYPICSYYLIKGPDGQYILILGDVHDDSYDKHMKALIGELKMVKLSQPLRVFEEWDEDDEVLDWHSAPNIVDIHEYLVGRKGFAELTSVEPRGAMSDMLILFEKDFVKLLSEVLPDSIKQHATNSKKGRSWDTVRASLKRQKKSSFTPELKLTVGNYLAYVDKNFEVLKGLAQKYERDKELAELFNDKICGAYEETLVLIHKQLDLFDKDLMIDLAFNTIMVQYETVEELYKYYSAWQRCFLLHTDFMFYNAVMIDKILSGTDQKVSVVFVGHSHAKEIAPLLASLPKWKIVKQRSLSHKISPIQVVYEDDPLFEEELRDVVREFIKPLVRKECAQCPKTESMSRCGRCKYVKYCSAVCQKAAWQEHKKVCVPVKVKL